MSEGKVVQVTHKQTGEVSHLRPGSTPKVRQPEVQQASATADESLDQLGRRPSGLHGNGSPEADSGNPSGGGKPKGKSKSAIETFEQFIAHAYSQKGRKVTINSKVKKAISRDLALPEEASKRLQLLVAEDRLLAVPRQLLLVSLEVTEMPKLRASLRDFAREALLSHPIFQVDGLVNVLRNLEDAPQGARAIALLDQWQPPDGAEGSSDRLKASEVTELRRNAAYALLIWMAIEKSLAPYDVVIGIHQALWSRQPVLSPVDDRAAWLRAVTDITQVAETGLACQSLVDKAAELENRSSRFKHETESAKQQVANLEDHLARTEVALSEAQLELQRTQQKVEVSIKALRDQHDTEMIHLRDDFERLRTRVLRRLTADVETLEVGLSALRTPEPKVHVLQDRLERVSDAMRTEIKTLREGG